MNSKNIFITIGEPFAARMFRTGFWPRLLENNKNYQFIILTIPEKKDYYNSIFGGKNVIVEGLRPKFSSKYSKLLSSLARSALDTHTNLWSKMRSYERADSSLFSTYIKRIHTFIFGRSKLYKSFLRYLFCYIKPNEDVNRIFDKYDPNCAFVTSLTDFDFDVPIATEARRRNKKIIGMVRSWDNLTSHGMLRVVPDVFILQNTFLQKSALKYQGIGTRTRLEVIGSPYYDIYKNYLSLIENRIDFFKKLNLDPNKKTILYGAMGNFLFPHEGELAEIFEKMIEKNKFKHPIQVIFRAHPKFESPLESIKNLKYVKPDRGGTYLANDLKTMEFENSDTKYLINTFFHSDIVVTGGSTFAIDAAIFDKPTVCIGFDGLSKEVPFWHSVKRFYDSYTHFEELINTGGVKIANDELELADIINSYLDNPSIDRDGRHRILNLFMEPFDGKAADRLFEIIDKEINK